MKGFEAGSAIKRVRVVGNKSESWRTMTPEKNSVGLRCGPDQGAN